MQTASPPREATSPVLRRSVSVTLSRRARKLLAEAGATVLTLDLTVEFS